MGEYVRVLQRTAAAAVTLLLAMGGATASGHLALAQSGADDASQAGLAPLGSLLADSRLTPSLSGFEVQGPLYERAYADWSATLVALADARRIVAHNQLVVAQVGAEHATVTADVGQRRLRLSAMTADLNGLDLAMSQLAVSTYVRGGPVGEAAALFEVGDVTNELYAQTIERDVGNDQLRRRATLRGDIERLQVTIDEQTSRLADLEARSAEASTTIQQSGARVVALAARVPALEAALRDARLSAAIVGTDLPLVALDAYVRAAARLTVDKPTCGLQWFMIAALGRIESKHGNVNGATLQPDGRTSLRIIGVTLDGGDGTAQIDDTDNGQLDGDAEFDHAVGPMQFIPSTWAIYRRDGNGDGVADPHNLYDAALAAATFLCSSGKSLGDVAGLREAYLAYNRSTTYGTTALANVERYRKLVFPPQPR